MPRSRFRVLREHPILTRSLVLGVTAFLCCFAFPRVSIGALHTVCISLMMGLCLAEAYGPGRTRGVFLRLLAAAAAGLLGRYLLEYGEVSNTLNFTAENVVCFLALVPLGLTAAYLIFVNRLLENSGGR